MTRRIPVPPPRPIQIAALVAAFITANAIDTGAKK